MDAPPTPWRSVGTSASGLTSDNSLWWTLECADWNTDSDFIICGQVQWGRRTHALHCGNCQESMRISLKSAQIKTNQLIKTFRTLRTFQCLGQLGCHSNQTARPARSTESNFVIALADLSCRPKLFWKSWTDLLCLLLQQFCNTSLTHLHHPTSNLVLSNWVKGTWFCNNFEMRQWADATVCGQGPGPSCSWHACTGAIMSTTDHNRT